MASREAIVPSMTSDSPSIDVDWRLRERRREARDDGWQTSGGVVVDLSNAKVLLVNNRRERKEGTNGWTWPKGKMDVGEGPLFAAQREIVEEAGVMVEPLARLPTLKTKRATRHYFLFGKIADGIEVSKETSKIKWVTLRQARRLLERQRDRRVLRAAKQLIRDFRDGQLSEHLLWSDPAAE